MAPYTVRKPKIALYADDVLLFCIINSHQEFLALQEDIDKVGRWSCANYLTLNRAKCKYDHFLQKNSLNSTITSSSSRPSIGPGETFKYLGILLSHDLTWGDHIQLVYR